MEGWGDNHPPQQAHRPLSIEAAVESGVCFVEPRSNTLQGHRCRCFDTDGVGPGRVEGKGARELLTPGGGGGVGQQHMGDLKGEQHMGDLKVSRYQLVQFYLFRMRVIV